MLSLLLKSFIASLHCLNFIFLRKNVALLTLLSSKVWSETQFVTWCLTRLKILRHSLASVNLSNWINLYAYEFNTFKTCSELSV